MTELNKDRIFNESSKKVLIREYEKLKEDYSKLNALQYKTLYENESLSFILENSRYIFSEPLKGYDFYKGIVENVCIPFDKMEDEYQKVLEYVEDMKTSKNVSVEQISAYESLLGVVTNVYESMKNSVNVYINIMENTECTLPVYDALYEYERNTSDTAYDTLLGFIESADGSDIMDVIHIAARVPELSSNIYTYLESVYCDHPNTIEEYQINSFVTNTISRMMRDTFVKESVSTIGNMNLRHLIQGLSGVTASEMMESVTTEVVTNYKPAFADPQSAINRIFADDVYSEMFKEQNDEEKLHRLLCEKEIISMNLSFVLIDQYLEERVYPNLLVERICIESHAMTAIPSTYDGQIQVLQERYNDISKEIVEVATEPLMERYFSANGGPSKIVAQSIGITGDDSKSVRKPDNVEKEVAKVYSPSTQKDDRDNVDDNVSDDNDTEDNVKLQEQKKRQTDKYSKMDINDKEFSSISESKYEELEKPEKKNIFQRIQNKALDANVQFKKKVAESRRTSVDVKNAGKAVAKIPMSVTDSIKKTVNEWDEMDDNRRKEYIIKPGFRKKYFKALKLCIMHYGAFAVNPVLNIVLAICQKFSHSKDIRIRNELVRELKAEIKVTEEKIEDAKANGDNKQKYQLMRIKEKLDAELVRVGVNSKYI